MAIFDSASLAWCQWQEGAVLGAEHPSGDPFLGPKCDVTRSTLALANCTFESHRVHYPEASVGLIVVPKLNMDFPACFQTCFLTSGRVVMDHLLISSCNFIIDFNWSCWCFIIFRESCFLIFKQTGKIFFKCIHISKIYCNISN